MADVVYQVQIPKHAAVCMAIETEALCTVLTFEIYWSDRNSAITDAMEKVYGDGLWWHWRSCYMSLWQ